MAKIVGLRGLDGMSGLGDAAAVTPSASLDPNAIPMPGAPPARPALTLAGVLMVGGSMALVSYIFWATLRGPKKRSGFARNGRRRYRRRKRGS